MEPMPSQPPQRQVDAACVWIVDGGPTTPERPTAPAPTFVIAVDRGGRHALDLGLRVDVLIGDLDSIDEQAHQTLVAAGTQVQRHPVDKTRSDLDLAIQYAAELEPVRIEILSGGGGRLDHLLVSATMLGRPDVALLPICMHTFGTSITATAAGAACTLDAATGDTVTLLAVGGDAATRSSGLHWDLTPDMLLTPGSSLGLSNVAVVDSPTIDVDPASTGVILAVVVPR